MGHRSEGVLRFKLFSIILIAVGLGGSPLWAEERPEEIGVPYAVATGSGKLLPLERQRVNSGVRVKALGYGGTQTVTRFSGRTSPVRLKQANDLQFVIRFASMPPTPASFINLDTLTAKKDSRESISAKTGFLGLSGKSTLGDTEVQLKFIPGGDAVLSITPLTPLAPGEYVFTLKDEGYGFLFTVIP